MQEIREGSYPVVDIELKRIISKYGLFRDEREGESVLREEYEEVSEALETVKLHLREMWMQIRKDKPLDSDSIERMGAASVELICEAVQVTAVIKKLLLSMEGWKDELGSINRTMD